MTEKGMKFIEMVYSDEEMKNAFQNCKDIESFLNIAKDMGHDLTAEDFAEENELESHRLGDEELDAVAGGKRDAGDVFYKSTPKFHIGDVAIYLRDNSTVFILGSNYHGIVPGTSIGIWFYRAKEMNDPSREVYGCQSEFGKAK